MMVGGGRCAKAMKGTRRVESKIKVANGRAKIERGEGGRLKMKSGIEGRDTRKGSVGQQL